MNELDLLKKNWNKTEHFPSFSEEKIYAMLHKNSSSAVKWIFIISIIEFFLGILLNFGVSFTKSHQETMSILKKAGIFEFYQIVSAIIWFAAVIFMYLFYKRYREISTTANVKKLMETILSARKTVKHYIVFNLVAASIFLLVIYSFALKEILQSVSIEQHKELTTSIYIGAFVGVILVTAIIILCFWLIYRVIYGILLRRLKNNYTELEKIDL